MTKVVAAVGGPEIFPTGQRNRLIQLNVPPAPVRHQLMDSAFTTLSNSRGRWYGATAVNIDAELVVGVESNVVSLASGCICCSMRDDLLATVIETIERPEAPEYVLLEASGLADPSGIGMTFNSPVVRDRLRLDSILCVVDAEQVLTVPELMELKLFQMACGDADGSGCPAIP